jgi:hypothetical protein
MQTVIVTYKVSESFADTNAANIERVMADMRELADDSVRYHAFRKDDGVSFVHFAMFRDEAAKERGIPVPSFEAFQSALKASKPVEPPKASWVDLVGATYPIF